MLPVRDHHKEFVLRKSTIWAGIFLVAAVLFAIFAPTDPPIARTIAVNGSLVGSALFLGYAIHAVFVAGPEINGLENEVVAVSRQRNDYQLSLAKSEGRVKAAEDALNNYKPWFASACDGIRRANNIIAMLRKQRAEFGGALAALRRVLAPGYIVGQDEKVIRDLERVSADAYREFRSPTTTDGEKRELLSLALPMGDEYIAVSHPTDYFPPLVSLMSGSRLFGARFALGLCLPTVETKEKGTTGKRFDEVVRDAAEAVATAVPGVIVDTPAPNFVERRVVDWSAEAPPSTADLPVNDRYGAQIRINDQVCFIRDDLDDTSVPSGPFKVVGLHASVLPYQGTVDLLAESFPECRWSKVSAERLRRLG